MRVTDMVRVPFRRAKEWAVRSLQNFTLSGLTDEQARALGFVRSTLSRVNVSDKTALESVEYFAGIRNVSEDLATLPLITYRRVGDRRREIDVDHPLSDLLHYQPNDEMDSVQFIEMMQAWLMIRRNCYAEVQRTNGGRIVGLWPIPTPRVYVFRFEGQLYYRVHLPNGERDPVTGLPYTTLPRDRAFHLKAFSLDGVLGEDSIKLHQETIGLALALDRYGAEWFGADSTPGGFYRVPTTLSPEAYERMKKELSEPHQGIGNKHRIQLLEDGAEFQPAVVDNDKAQFLESKRYSTEQMGRLNRIAPHKIGDLSRATFSNIEHQGIDYVVSTIRPYAVRWERGIATQLMTRDERRTHSTEFMLDALLRGDAISQAQALAIERQNGIINGDEWRALKNRNEIEDGSGKAYLVNGNMIPILQAGSPRKVTFDDEGKPRHIEITERREIDPARVFAPLFRAAAETCLRKETAAVGKALEREFRAKGMKAFEGWMLEFYREQESTVRRVFVPLAVSVGEAIRGVTGPDLGQWADEYALSVAAARRKVATEGVRAVVSSGSSDMEGALRAMVERWATEDEFRRMAAAESAAMVESLRRHLANDPGLAA